MQLVIPHSSLLLLLEMFKTGQLLKALFWTWILLCTVVFPTVAECAPPHGLQPQRSTLPGYVGEEQPDLLGCHMKVILVITNRGQQPG